MSAQVCACVKGIRTRIDKSERRVLRDIGSDNGEREEEEEGDDEGYECEEEECDGVDKD